MDPVRIIGADPLAKDETGRLKSRIGTVFPGHNTMVTLPGIHATQRMAFAGILSQERRDAGLSPLDDREEMALWNGAVDLIMEDDALLIRPDPENMHLAFQADELLQRRVSKHKIRFLHVLNRKVRDAIKRRGECWRINPLPRSPEEMKDMIASSRVGIGGKEIYRFNKTTGVRLLTYQGFAQLGALDDDALRRHLTEIEEYAGKTNPQGNPEIDFFMADFAPCGFQTVGSDQLRSLYESLCQRFRGSVPPEFRRDDPDDTQWRNRMCAALLGHEDEGVSEETLLGLSPEFFMQIEWLPGGRIEERELIFDSIFQEREDRPDDRQLQGLCDEKSRKFIFNFVREYGDLEYVNVGRVIGSLSKRSVSFGRRDVYVAEVKERESDQEIVSIIRMQKWGVREHLDQGKDLLEATIQSEEYTEYILDRRLGCRQLGMNLPRHVSARKITERYFGKQKQLHGTVIWSPYFERDYIHGIATDKLPSHRLENDAFVVPFARLLGRAAASNIIVGRCSLDGNVLFDDGDEVLVEDENQMPAEIVVADHTGAFVDYRSELETFAADYAACVNRRIEHVSDPEGFSRAFLEALVARFSRMQQEYRSRKRAFDSLFGHRRRDEAGSFAYRWEKVLERLDRTDALELKNSITEYLTAN